LWAAVAATLLQDLASGDLDTFETRFRIVSDALKVCPAAGRQAAMPLLFGDFTRRAIAASFDRTRFVEWFGPAEILAAPSGRMRGRALYFDNSKGRGKLLGADGTVCFVHYSFIRASGFRSLDGGQLVEFRPQRGSYNGVEGIGAYDVTPVAE
jgi:CspA family cold shock protein